MELTQWAAILAVLVSLASVAMSLLRSARLAGADQQRVESLEHAVGNLATAESVLSNRTRIDTLEHRVKNIDQALNQVGVLAANLQGLDRLVTQQLDEIKYTLRRLDGTSEPQKRARPQP